LLRRGRARRCRGGQRSRSGDAEGGKRRYPRKNIADTHSDRSPLPGQGMPAPAADSLEYVHAPYPAGDWYHMLTRRHRSQPARNVPALEHPAAAAQIPVGRVGQPDDVAHAVSFIASEGAGFVSGQVLYVAGGPLC
jgi:hypothetical protein